MEVLSTSGLKALPENKQYSRERSREFAVRGRVRVQIKNDDGTPCNPEFPSSKSHFKVSTTYDGFLFLYPHM